MTINKELAQLSPVMDAFAAVSKLEDVRAPPAQPLWLTARSPRASRPQEMAALAEVVASAGDDAEMRALAEEARPTCR